MFFKLKKLIFSFTFNSLLFLFMIISIQNSSNKSKIYFFNNETVKLPISFIFGVSFITGSAVGTFAPFLNSSKS